MYVEIMEEFPQLFVRFALKVLNGLSRIDLWKPYIINGATRKNEYLLIIIIIDYDDC